ncbi:MAG: hypothetical protein P4M15_00465, partial [Alphaproteobacteria bacterium]|nr:hypothetical protein [Alphaproteobacteria bacterium]
FGGGAARRQSFAPPFGCRGGSLLFLPLDFTEYLGLTAGVGFLSLLSIARLVFFQRAQGSGAAARLVQTRRMNGILMLGRE